MYLYECSCIILVARNYYVRIIYDRLWSSGKSKSSITPQVLASSRRWRFEMLVCWTAYHGRLLDLSFYMHQARLSAAIAGPFWWSIQLQAQNAPRTCWELVHPWCMYPKIRSEIDHFRGHQSSNPQLPTHVTGSSLEDGFLNQNPSKLSLQCGERPILGWRIFAMTTRSRRQCHAMAGSASKGWMYFVFDFNHVLASRKTGKIVWMFSETEGVTNIPQLTWRLQKEMLEIWSDQL